MNNDSKLRQSSQAMMSCTSGVPGMVSLLKQISNQQSLAPGVQLLTRQMLPPSYFNQQR